MNIRLSVADSQHFSHAEEICKIMEEAAKQRGTGIAKRKPEYIRAKMEEGKAVIAIDTEGNKFAGFSYIESWDNKKYIANSGLIVHPHYRGMGLGRKIKEKVFNLSRTNYPNAKIFGITTSMAVMKINSDMGYRPVTFSELTQDEAFWKGCQSCPNYDILTNENRKDCLCTGMLYDPKEQKEKKTSEKDKQTRWKKFKRFVRLHQRHLQRKTKQFLNLTTSKND
ncbi:GNAT family N-acetyltransferase [Fodinibius sediminis]|uniref:Acetyltransferase (GNAT) domain-containing protein n=1 Tax=Fodinibius sediminis TaxID=1214077 RepID=A0A521CAU7_9BACT|nr:GNAT family N-acetyltransferase [Fodinibius sediminis]SMO56582.1 Acetyltransferase (GNAT) domain-containing protein [Fodinibius sediminis]